MKTAMIFIYLSLFFVALYIYYSIRIVNELRKRDLPINFLFLRVLIIKYAHQYKKITAEERGHPGEYYRPWLLSVNAAAICAIIALLMKFWHY